MARKPPLYALVWALTVGWAPLGRAQDAGAEPPGTAPPPCGTCVTLGVAAAGFPEDLPSGARVALVASPGELAAVSGNALGAVRAAIVDLHGGGALDERDLAARRSLTELRARRPDLKLGAFAPAAAIDALLARDLAAYVDFVVVVSPDPATRARWLADHPGLEVWRPAALPSFERLLDESVRAPGEPLLVWPAPSVTRELLEDLERLADFFPASLVEAREPDTRCTPAEDCLVRTFERPETGERVHWLSRRPRAGPRSSVPVAIVIDAARAEMAAVSTSVAAAPGVADSVLPLAPQVPDASGRLRLFLPLTAVSSLIIRVPPVDPPGVEKARLDPVSFAANGA